MPLQAAVETDGRVDPTIVAQARRNDAARAPLPEC